MNQTLGLYIHIPFCVQKCRYCDFTSYAKSGEDIKNRYIKLLINHIKLASTTGPTSSAGPLKGRIVDSVFFGGGTPSLLSPGQMREIIDALREEFQLTEDCEFTMEANPGTVTLDSLKAYRQMGINRISFGVQSMEDEILEGLGRIHRSQEAVHSVVLAREAGFDNLNLDLMFGIPGQTLDQWNSTLEKITALEPEHISFYSLQVEEGTPIYNDIKFGRLEPLTDEEDRAMYHAGLSYLREQGYHQYEISNGAKPGKDCRHNVKYWTLKEYIGFGVSAHGFVDGVRYSAGDDLTEYMDTLEQGKLPVVWENKNTLEETASEFLFTGLRLACGVDLDEFKERFHTSLEDMYPHIMEELEQFRTQGYLVMDKSTMYLTELGMDISNRIMALFV